MIRADAGLALRPARPDDADAVAAMCAALARHEGSSAPTMSAERFLAKNPELSAARRFAALQGAQ